MYETVCYKKPFLKDVIVRINFASPIEGFQRALPPKVASSALFNFPISEPQKLQEQTVTITHESIENQRGESMQWTYHGREREKTLHITSEYVSLVLKSYKSYEAMRLELDPILDVIFETQKDLVASRVGVRFVNVLDMPHDGDPFAWGDFVRPDMLATINAHKATGILSRAFQIVEFNNNGRSARFQFGLANPDFPAPVRRRQFVIDIDAYYQGALTLADVSTEIDAAHTTIQQLFEASITDATRALMGTQNVE